MRFGGICTAALNGRSACACRRIRGHDRIGTVTRIVCQQLAPRVGEPEANRLRATAAIVDALEAGARLIVLPELSTSGYMFDSLDELRAAALRPSDPLFSMWADLVRRADAVVIAGFAEVDDDGALYNSAVVVDGSGVRAVYRKTHLWDREKLFFSIGNELPPVIETSVGRIGVLICYDLEFPELSRRLAVEGADVLVVPTNWPRMPKLLGVVRPEVVTAMAIARINRLAVAACDRSGDERGQQWNHGTSIIDLTGEIVAATEEIGGSAIADLDLMLSRDKRYTAHAHALDDRRLDLY
jgi:predicted amidohydrolase